VSSTVVFRPWRARQGIGLCELVGSPDQSVVVHEVRCLSHAHSLRHFAGRPVCQSQARNPSNASRRGSARRRSPPRSPSRQTHLATNSSACGGANSRCRSELAKLGGPNFHPSLSSGSHACPRLVIAKYQGASCEELMRNQPHPPEEQTGGFSSFEMIPRRARPSSTRWPRRSRTRCSSAG